jgi:hypothetical protein
LTTDCGIDTTTRAELLFLVMNGSVLVGGISDRHQEIRRRRKRRQKLSLYKKRLKKATVSERGVIAEKIRKMTPGAEIIIAAWGLEERK